MAGNMFVNKLGGTLAMLLFTSFLLMGKDVGDDLGIRAVALSAMVICFIAYFIARTYDEDEILKYNSESPEGVSQSGAASDSQKVTVELV